MIRWFSYLLAFGTFWQGFHVAAYLQNPESYDPLKLIFCLALPVVPIAFVAYTVWVMDRKWTPARKP